MPWTSADEQRGPQGAVRDAGELKWVSLLVIFHFHAVSATSPSSQEEKKQIAEDKLLCESFHSVAPGTSSRAAPGAPSEQLHVCGGHSPPPSANTTVCSASRGAGYLVRFVGAFNRLLNHVPLKYLRQHLPKAMAASRWAQANYLQLAAGRADGPAQHLPSHTAASGGTSTSACLKSGQTPPKNCSFPSSPCNA